MIRVLHVDTGREWRGGQTQVFGLLRTLRGSEDLQQILCAPPDSPLAQRAREIEIELCPLPLRGELDFSSSREMRRFIEQRGIHVVHAHDAHAHTLAMRAVKRLPSVRLVVHRRVDFPIRHGLLGRRKYGPRVDAYVAISRGVFDVMRHCGLPEHRIEIIPSGVDLRKFEGVSPGASIREDLGIPADVPVVGNVASLVDHKGHVYLIDAMRRVIRSIPRAHCVIVGDGELRDDIEMFIESCGAAATQMRIAGWREDIGRCLQQMDVFCLSSHMEGLCTSLLDATLMNVPLVAFETGGVPDIVRDGETGWLAPVRDSEALAKALIEALSNSDEAKRRAANARRRTEELFAIEKTAEKTLALWRRLVAEGSSHG